MAQGAVDSPIAVVGRRRRRDRTPIEEPAGFYGAGRVGGWAATWSARDRLLFDAVAGDLLVDAGLRARPRVGGDGGERRRFAASVKAQRLVAVAGRKLGYQANLLMRRVPDAAPGAGRMSAAGSGRR